MYPYLEISQGYGRKRRSVAVLGAFSFSSAIYSTGTSEIFGEAGSSQFQNESGPFSLSAISGSGLFPTGSPTSSTSGIGGNAETGSTGGGIGSPNIGGIGGGDSIINITGSTTFSGSIRDTITGAIRENLGSNPVTSSIRDTIIGAIRDRIGEISGSTENTGSSGSGSIGNGDDHGNSNHDSGSNGENGNNNGGDNGNNGGNGNGSNGNNGGGNGNGQGNGGNNGNGGQGIGGIEVSGSIGSGSIGNETTPSSFSNTPGSNEAIDPIGSISANGELASNTSGSSTGQNLRSGLTTALKSLLTVLNV